MYSYACVFDLTISEDILIFTLGCRFPHAGVWLKALYFFLLFLYFCFAFFCIFTWVHVSPCPQVFGWRQGNVQSHPGRTCHVSTTWSKTWSINVLQQKKYFSFTFYNNFCLFCFSWKTRNLVNHLRQPYPPILQFDILGKDFISQLQFRINILKTILCKSFWVLFGTFQYHFAYFAQTDQMFSFYS